MTAIKPTTRNLELGTENRGTQNLRHSVALAFNANSAVFPMPEPLPPLDFNGNGHVAVVHCHPLSPTPVPNPRRVYWFCKAAKWASGQKQTSWPKETWPKTAVVRTNRPYRKAGHLACGQVILVWSGLRWPHAIGQQVRFEEVNITRWNFHFRKNLVRLCWVNLSF